MRVTYSSAQGTEAMLLERVASFSKAFPNSVMVTLTQTMLEKGIIDATEPIRALLRRAEIHNFEAQGKGTGEKVLVNAARVGVSSGKTVTLPTTVSLYRPSTKNGDPRFWIYGLNKEAVAGDRIAMGVGPAKSLIIVNLSAAVSGDQWRITESEFQALAPQDEFVQDQSLARLVGKLQAIAASGPVPADGHGDTAVGRTMETALGIPINSSRMPDWEDKIELKFGRPRPTQRRTLFAKVPDWSQSVLKSSREILDNFGYHRDGVFRLYVEVGAKPNPQGLFLYADEQAGQIRERSTNPQMPEVVTWPLADLQAALLHKHKQTCWVVCEESTHASVVYFQPTEILYTHSPRADLIPLLVSTGEMTLDHLIKEKGAGATEKGPLWKISKAAAPQLLTVAQEFKLL